MFDIMNLLSVIYSKFDWHSNLSSYLHHKKSHCDTLILLAL